MKKLKKNETEVHYLYIKTKIPTTRHKQTFGNFKFKPWDGCQMVNTESLILYSGLKSKLKCNKININKIYSFISTYN